MSQIPRTKLIKAPKATAKNLLRPYIENSLRPSIRAYLVYRYTQVTQKRVLIGMVRAT